jgi:hypothetical protein
MGLGRVQPITMKHSRLLISAMELLMAVEPQQLQARDAPA